MTPELRSIYETSSRSFASFRMTVWFYATRPRPPSSASQSLAYNRGMANLILVYGLRLLPSDEVAEVGAATIKLKNGREAHVAMHILEGGKAEIEKQLKTSLAAFFDIYPEI
jgi:hypothetical protein